jgi:hypothetical protein
MKIARIVAASIVLALLIGCGTIFIPEQGLSALENKWGEKFEYKGPYGSGYTKGDTLRFLATCKTFGNKDILVTIHRDKGKIVVKDNYMVRYMETKAYYAFDEIFSQYLDDYKFVLHYGLFVLDGDTDMTLQEFLSSSGYSQISLYTADSNQEHFKESMSKACEDLAELCTAFNLWAYAVSAEQLEYVKNIKDFDDRSNEELKYLNDISNQKNGEMTMWSFYNKTDGLQLGEVVTDDINLGPMDDIEKP